jgi:ABC-type transport system substrate-binding protein
VDSGVIALHLKAQCPLSRLAMPYILPEGMKPSPDEWIGTGPFQATSLEPGIWQLQSNPHYFLGKPFLGEIIIQEYPDPHALEIALISGEVHFAIGIDAPGEDFVVKREADVQRFHLHFLMKEELVQNLVLRKAIALGLDREALARAAGLKEPHYSAGPFDHLLNERLSQPPLPPDPQTTRFLLKSMSNLGDSVFRVKCYTNDPRERLLEEVLVEQLNGLGIPTQAGKPPHAVLTCRGVGTFELESRLWASTSSPAYNFGYSNPKVDELIRQCVNSEPAPALLRQLRRLIQQDMPDIPLFYDELSVTYVKQLQALENRIILLAGLNEIHTWYLSVNEETEEKERALD